MSAKKPENANVGRFGVPVVCWDCKQVSTHYEYLSGPKFIGRKMTRCATCAAKRWAKKVRLGPMPRWLQ